MLNFSKDNSKNDNCTSVRFTYCYPDLDHVMFALHFEIMHEHLRYDIAILDGLNLSFTIDKRLHNLKHRF